MHGGERSESSLSPFSDVRGQDAPIPKTFSPDLLHVRPSLSLALSLSLAVSLSLSLSPSPSLFHSFSVLSGVSVQDIVYGSPDIGPSPLYPLPSANLPLLPLFPLSHTPTSPLDFSQIGGGRLLGIIELSLLFRTPPSSIHPSIHPIAPVRCPQYDSLP